MTDKNGTGKVPSPLVSYEKIPEKLYFTRSRRAIDYIKWAGLDKKELSDDIEYILKSVADKEVFYFKNKAKFYKELTENIMDRYNKGGTMPVFTEIEEFENE